MPYIDTAYYSQRFENLLSAILSTGDGQAKETAIKIVGFDDDYVIKGALQFLGGERKEIIYEAHSYTIWTKDGKELYFEILFQ